MIMFRVNRHDVETFHTTFYVAVQGNIFTAAGISFNI